MTTLLDATYYIGMAVPPVCLADIMRKLVVLLPTLHANPSTGLYTFEPDEIGWNLVAFSLSGIFYLIICIFIDVNLFSKIIDFFDMKEEKFPSKGKVDSDVSAETDKVFSLSESDMVKKNLVTVKLSKFFGNFLAVNQLSFCVEPGECFGL